MLRITTCTDYLMISCRFCHEADEADEADKEDEPVEQSQKGNATSDGNTPNASPKDSLF